MKALFAAAIAAAIFLLTGAGAQSLAGSLRSAAALYYAHVRQIEVVAGRETTMDYYDRLMTDADLLSEQPPNDDRGEKWRRTTRAASELDLSLATQLLQRSYQPMAAIRGLGETLVRSSKDGTMQPLAVYVPTHYVSSAPSPLIVFLHGRDQPESYLVAPEYIQELAERSGTIVLAPYARGAYDYAGVESDVYDAFNAANRAFAIDPRRRYLAGYSMGGFSVFRLAPMHPSDWTAVMSIAGSMLASRASRLVRAMPSNERFYILTGARDDTVSTLWPTATAIFLRDAGFPVTFYSQSDGTHSLLSLQPILSQAWSDMERGTVRSPGGLTGAANLPDVTH